MPLVFTGVFVPLGPSCCDLSGFTGIYAAPRCRRVATAEPAAPTGDTGIAGIEPADLDANITAVSDTSWTITRSLVDRLLANQAALMSAALGLTIGTRFEPRQVPLIFSLLVIPMTFLGGVYYPWQSLSPLPWLKWAVLVNPLIYMSEGMRMSLTNNVPHMAAGYVYLALIGFTAVFLRAGTTSFAKRVLT